ncbi:Heme transporter hrg-1 [Frankliniella fusca]|uniref:Heme transporter hrg-1 n=1 Tax=Frankliniella fusca TaxID=407009 RepID=A0AAE1LTP1_9NEOP|nr:Heme transporter hrg-1 [Frankliniella fusca]
MADRGFCHYFRLVSSSLGVLVGLLACIAFSAVYTHVVASVLAFLSAVFAAVCLVLHILHHRNVLHVWHSPDTLNDLSILGFCVLNIGFSLTSWYLFDIIYYHKPMMPVDGSPYISAVWAFMTGKWGTMLWYDSRKYAANLATGSLLDD